MRHLPCIPDEIVCRFDREECYDIERNWSGPRYPVSAKLLDIVDKLAGAYLEVARERDQLKGLVELAGDDEFWEAVAETRERTKVMEQRKQEHDAQATVRSEAATGG